MRGPGQHHWSDDDLSSYSMARHLCPLTPNREQLGESTGPSRSKNNRPGRLGREMLLTRLRQRPHIRWADLAARSVARLRAGSSCWVRPPQGWLPAASVQLLPGQATWTRSWRHDCCFRYCCPTGGDESQRPPSGRTKGSGISRDTSRSKVAGIAAPWYSVGGVLFT